MISSNEMPPLQYQLVNPEARLTDAPKAALIAGLLATFGSSRGGAEQLPHYTPKLRQVS